MAATSSQTQIKILAIGSANGQIRSLFSKASAINSKHGPFDILLCLGDLFGPAADEATVDDLIGGRIDVPITTYFTTGETPLPDRVGFQVQNHSGEVCPNLFHLGRQGILTTAQGIKIAYLSGVYDPSTFDAKPNEEDSDENSESIKTETTYHSSDIASLSTNQLRLNPQGPAGVDILLTQEWPRGITDMASKPPENLFENAESSAIAELSQALNPRYHFATRAGVFFEREPYFNNSPGVIHSTRFIGLATLGNAEKSRWFYAFNIIPLKHIQPSVLQQQLPNTTENPLTQSSQLPRGIKRPFANEQTVQQPNSFFWSDSPTNNATESRGSGNKKRAPPEGYLCNRCKIPGHYIKDCPQPPPASAGEDRRRLPEGYICRLCSSTEHHIRDCPQAIGNREKQQGDHHTTGRQPPEGYICKICNGTNHFIRECPQRSEESVNSQQRRTTGDPESCWFCLVNPKVAKHLIVSIGTEVYMTLAKGPVVKTPGSVIPGGGHVLLIPVAHHSSFRGIDIEQRIDVITEIERFKSALSQLFQKYGCQPVIFEVSRGSIEGAARRGLAHAHIQIVPVLDELVEGLEAAFKDAAVNEGWTFTENLPEETSGNGYFRVELPNGKQLAKELFPGEHFNLQFGRTVLAKVLAAPERGDWKKCAQSVEEEKRDASEFRKAFKPFDFTM